MRRFSSFLAVHLGLLAMLVLLFAALGGTALSEGEAAPAPQADAQKVRTGLYMLNVGRLDTVNASYTADFYLTFKCDTDCKPRGFELMNGATSNVDKQLDDQGDKLYRVRASLNTKVDFRNYSFDKQDLLISLEDRL